ncbi:UNVERIFIED_CONTAM: hypothetical protein GTU68_056674 [Idotea baltica]|nr:hypothetical protein [Idotea baltica]
MKSAAGYREKGIASWYGKKFHGRKTAIGETYDMYQMTAAHKTLPLPSYVEVVNLTNGRKIVVRVNDRGPFHAGRIIDLSYSAAKKLDIIGHGTGKVEVRALNPNTYTSQREAIQAKPEPVLKLPADHHKHDANSHSHNHDVASGPAVFLQVGTYSSVERAETFKNQLAEQVDEPVFLMPLYRPEGRLYRVRIGPIKDIESSESLAAKLKSIGVRDSHAVIE